MDNKRLPIIANAKWVSFGWYEYYLSELKKYANRRGYETVVVYDIQDLSCFRGERYVIVNGSDINWVKQVFAELDSLGISAIVQNGDIMDYRSTAHEIYTYKSSIMRKGVEYFREHGRSRVALFGVKSDDTSDRTKIRAFAEYNAGYKPEDVFYTRHNLEACFREFRARAADYDAVICADDIVGVYMINACKRSGIRIPEDMFVIGNGNMRISQYCSPPLSTFMNQFTNSSTHMELLIQTFEMLQSYPQIFSLHIGIDALMINRQSTGGNVLGDDLKARFVDLIDDYSGDATFIEDPVVGELCTINHAICVSDKMDLAIVARQINDESYVKTAGALFVSVDTVKYRLKKIYKRFNVSGRRELSALLAKYGISFGQGPCGTL